MCGITAAFAYGPRARTVDQSQIARACDRMACRGPDGDGVWVSDDGRVGLGHRRLAIIDLSATGAQPMTSHDGTCVITFNGEIYNYRSLRAQLQKRGCVFSSTSDTEVLLHLYREKGDRFVEELRGMFAFAIWDARKQGMLLARDPFGIKPLYYANNGQALYAASEVKTLLRSYDIARTPDPAGQVGFFLWGHVPEPHTLYKSIRALPAGATLWVGHDGSVRARQYADLSALLSRPMQARDRLSLKEAEEELRAAVLDSVEHHLVADVDVGVFLSAGLDSTALTALATESTGRLRTITLGFAEFRGTAQDETPLAEMIARRYGTQHQTIWITREDFARESVRLIDRMDQPTIDGVNSYFVARAAADAGLKVALSGLGGDELLGGYPSFRQIPRLVSALERIPASAHIGRGLRMVSAPLVGRFTSSKYAGLLEYGATFGGAYLLRRGMFLPWELKGIIPEDILRAGLAELEPLARLEASVEGIRSDRLKVSALEAAWYMKNQLLRDTDWASMSHSIEVRVPLVDWTLWSRVAPLLAAHPSLGKASLGGLPRLAIPTELAQRPKTGFVVPTRQWLSEEEPAMARERGLRGWARYVYDRAA